MLKVGTKVINIPIEDVLSDFQDYMARRGESIFGELKVTGNNIMVKCPIHKNGQERKPSCGILVNDVGDTPAGTVHCFTCGYTASLPELFSYLLGDKDSAKTGEQWLLDTYINNIDNIRRPIQLAFNSSKQPEVKYVSEEELDSYRYIHPYMYKRKLTDQVIDMFDIGYDKDAKCITMPVNDKDGRCLFIARRSVVGKFFNYPTNVEKPVYGLDKIVKLHPKSIIVCESVFNCLSCYVYGTTPAVALLGTGTAEQYKELEGLGIREFILGLDPDPAGIRGRNKFYEYFKNKAYISYLDVPEGKDINDLSKEEFLSLKKVPMNY